MSTLEKTAHMQGRKDEIPNQELARELAEHKDKKGIHEIAEHLWDTDKNLQADCIKVLYEVGYLKPELIADYVDDFVKLLGSKNNRLVWGGMTLAAVASTSSARNNAIFPSLLQHIATCRSKDVPQHAEKTLVVVNDKNKAEFIRILKQRLPKLSNAQAGQVKKVIKAADKL